MQTTLKPYLSFRDNAREAMEFYQSIFGGKLDFQTYKDFHASKDPSEDNKIMHATLDADNGVSFMAADTPNSMEYKAGASVSLSLSGDNEAELKGYYDKLAEGGTIIMPFEKQMWGDMFGMVMDKYGERWMVNVFAPKTGE